MRNTLLFIGLLCFLTPLTTFAQEPTLSRVQAAPEADETELFIRQFHTVLNKIANDYPNDFKNIKGRLISDESSTSDKWAATAELPEAQEVYITRKLEMDLTTVTSVYVALFYDDTDQSMAQNIYDNLIWLVNNCSFECCSFVYDSVESDDAKTTYWMPYENGGIAKYDNMLMEVRLYKSFDITDDLEFIDTWNVVVNVSTFVE